MGLGTWKVDKDKAVATVSHAIKSGYRLIDCACDYGNEVEVCIVLFWVLTALLCDRLCLIQFESTMRRSARALPRASPMLV